MEIEESFESKATNDSISIEDMKIGENHELKKSETCSESIRDHNLVESDHSQLDPILKSQQLSYLKETLKLCFDNKYGEIFRKPVDPEKDNALDYLEVITHPIDLGTILSKIEDAKYGHPTECIEDFRLMISNCHTYNKPGTVAYTMGREVEKIFNRKLQKYPNSAPPQKRKLAVSPTKNIDRRDRSKIRKTSLSSSEEDKPPSNNVNSVPFKESLRSTKRANPAESPLNDQSINNVSSALSFCELALNEIFNKKHYEYAYPFLMPVDPIALGIPDYHDVIRFPMDFGTIRNKLKNFQYNNAHSFLRDARLIFTNCFRYNPATSEISTCASKLQRVFEVFMANAPQDLYYEIFCPDLNVDEIPINTRGTRRSSTIENRQFMDYFVNIERKLTTITDEITKLRTERPRYTNTENSEKKRSKPPTSTSTSSKNTFNSSVQPFEPIKIEETDPMTYEEKLALSSQIVSLPESRIKEIVAIINQREPWSKNINSSNSQTVEINLMTLTTSTLREIQKLVNSLNRRKSEILHRKKISVEDRGSRVEVLKRRLEDMDLQLSGKVPININKNISSKEITNQSLIRSDSQSDSELSDEELAKKFSLNKSKNCVTDKSNPPSTALKRPNTSLISKINSKNIQDITPPPNNDILKLREEERKKRMSLIDKIDMNAQSELMKTFEGNN